MSSSKAAKSKPTNRALSASDFFGSGSVAVGEVVEIAPDGRFLVAYPGISIDRLAARTIVQDLYVGAPVLLAFEGGDPTRPIVLGILHERIEARGTRKVQAARIVIEAQDELVLQCGEASIQARRDGKITLKGKDVVSRAARNNKVQGATVQLN